MAAASSSSSSSQQVTYNQIYVPKDGSIGWCWQRASISKELTFGETDKCFGHSISEIFAFQKENLKGLLTQAKLDASIHSIKKGRIIMVLVDNNKLLARVKRIVLTYISYKKRPDELVPKLRLEIDWCIANTLKETSSCNLEQEPLPVDIESVAKVTDILDSRKFVMVDED